MKYPEIVAQARKVAELTGEVKIVYHNLENNCYSYTTEWTFEDLRKTRPLIRMLTCLPNGAVAQ